MFVYFNGKYLPLDEVKISPFDRGFNFADGVYEVLRSYNNKLFRFNSHINRLKYSLNQLSITFSDYNLIKNISFELALINKITPKDFSVYIQITRGVKIPRQHYYENNIEPTVFISVSEIKNNNQRIQQGVKVILQDDIRWSRCDIKSISLLPSTLAKTKAINSGAYEAIFHRDDLITEGTHTNFFGVKDGVVFTAPLSNFILEGITREVVLELCKKNKIPVVEEYINISDLKNFDEFFITGTLTEIAPVIQIDDLPINEGLPGRITYLIQQLFNDYINSF